MAQTLRLASKPLLSSPPVFVFAGFSFLIYLYGYISIYSSFPIPFGYQNLISLAQLNSSWSAILISITIASLFPRFANNISRSTNRLHIQILEKSSHKSRRSQLTLISMIVLSFCTLIAVIVLFVFFSQLGLIADNRIFTAKAEYILILLFFSLSLGYAAYARPLSFPIKLFLLFQAFIVSNSIFLIDNSRFCFMPLFSMALGFLIRRMYILGFLSTAYSFLLVGAVLYNRSYDIEITVLSLFLPISINTLADVVLGSLNYTLGFSALNTTYALGKSFNDINLDYILSSLNPLPRIYLSSLALARIDIFRPLPAYAELLAVGNWMLIVVLAGIFYLLDFFRLSISWLSSPRTSALISGSFAILLSINMSQYNLRSSSRLLSTILFLVLAFPALRKIKLRNIL